MRTWFNITNAADEVATLSIYDEIGMWGITAADFSRALKGVTAKVINLEINSPGGSVFDGVAIYNMLKASGKTINATVMGVAASIASVILMAANKITMPANSMVMVHSPSGGVYGTAEEMRAMADLLDKVKASLIGVYMTRTGKSEAEIAALLSTDTWLTAAEAKDMGFADEVTDGVHMTAQFELDDKRLPEAARAAFKACADAAKLRADAEQAVAEAVAEAAAKAIVDAEQAIADAAAKATADAVPPFADQVVALLKDTGFEAHAAAWAVKFTKPEEVTARVAEAREITAMFALASKPEAAAALITAGKSLAEARIELQTLMAADDVHIDTAKSGESSGTAAAQTNPTTVYAKRAGVNKNSNQPTNQGPSAVSTAGIWANRNKQTTGV